VVFSQIGPTNRPLGGWAFGVGGPGYGRPMATQAIYYRAASGAEPVAEFLDREFPVEPRKKNPSARELQAAATKRMTVDLQIDRLNGPRQ
jgi:hypothetical protein